MDVAGTLGTGERTGEAAAPRGGGDFDLRALGLGLAFFFGDGEGDLDWAFPVAFCHRSALDCDTVPPLSGGLKACLAVVRLSALLGKLPVLPAGMRPP